MYSDYLYHHSTSLYTSHTSDTMPDCVAIVQDLPFRQSVCLAEQKLESTTANIQVIETAMHVSRSVATDQAAYRDFMTHFDTASLSGEGEQLSAEKKQEIIRDLVTRVTEGQGCLQGNKETGASRTGTFYWKRTLMGQMPSLSIHCCSTCWRTTLRLDRRNTRLLSRASFRPSKSVRAVLLLPDVYHESRPLPECRSFMIYAQL